MTQGTAAALPVEGYTIGQVLDEIRYQDVSLVLSGAGNILALLGAAVLDRLGERPQGKADVTVEISDVTEIRIRWGEEDAGQAGRN